MIILVNYTALLLKAVPPATCSSIIKQVIFFLKESSRLVNFIILGRMRRWQSFKTDHSQTTNHYATRKTTKQRNGLVLT